jgi:hypothetical protein
MPGIKSNALNALGHAVRLYNTGAITERERDKLTCALKAAMKNETEAVYAIDMFREYGNREKARSACEAAVKELATTDR